MSDHAYIGALITIIFYAIVGVRLARLSSRTQLAPEWLLSAMFLTTAASYTLYLLPTVHSLERLWTPLNFLGRLVYLPAPIILAIFTRQVFRPDSRWSSALVYGISAALVGGVTGSVLSGDWEGLSVGNPWFWLEWVGYTLPFLWAGIEASAKFRQARKRLRLGLCGAVACNRFLLWSLFGVLQVIASLAILLQYADYQQHNQFSPAWDMVVAGFEIVSVVVIWFVFFPPDFYRGWLVGDGASVDTV